jgi:NAD(P)-dependent dehydrogenase (short-subunit alcohol dehydrogenase family)
MDLGLKGKRVLVTGASKGIGLGCARAFAAEGCTLDLVARDKDRLEQARDLLASAGADCAIHPLDLSAPGAVERLSEAVPVPDIVVNNAGAIPGGDLQAIDEATWRQAWDLKEFGYINMARAFYPLMKAKGGGVIFNVIGLSGVKLDPKYIAGTAGNASLNAFTKAMGSNALADGMRVLGVNPGLVATDRLVTLLKTKASAEKGDESRWQDFLAGQPLGRAATVEEIADVVTFLCSPRAGWATGIVVDLDGGQTYR